MTARRLDPFSFFARHASAIAGLGGQEPSPDPRYCFHTPYETVPPGQTAFLLTMSDVRATVGELNVRVMAYREGIDAAMATSLRVDLEDIAQPELTRQLGFAAVDGIQYALYGFLSEPSDLSASAIEIALELRDEDDGADRGPPPRSRFADDEVVVAAGKLITAAPPSILDPVSQPYSDGQASELRESGLWSQIVAAVADPLACWKLALPLQAVAKAGMLQASAQAVLFDPPGPLLADLLGEAGCTVAVGRRPDGSEDTDPSLPEHDFAIGYAPALSPDGDLALAERLIGVLAGGGVGVAVFSFDRSIDEHEFRNSVQRIALRLIGLGHDVTQISMVPERSWLEPDRQDGAFALVIRS